MNEPESTTNLLPCPFCGDCNPELADSEIPTIQGNQKSAVFCNTCFCEGPTANCESDAVEMWDRRVSINHCKPAAASPDQIEIGKLAAFGKSVWDWIKANPDFCGDEFALTLMPMAEKAGLCKYETYDPEKHGEFADLVPGEDELYYWGNYERPI